MEVRLINIEYKNIFKNLNVEIEDKVITAIIGKNGSGKTSLLNLISGLDNCFNGEILLGRDLVNSKSNKKNIQEAQKDIFYLRQECQNDLFNVNVLEDIKYSSSNIDMNKLQELLKLFELDEKILRKNYLDLCGSEIKKALLIKMFLKDSKIILLDDPTNDLDQKSISSLIKLLKREKYNGKLILVASMDSEFLLKVADEFIVIDELKAYKIKEKYEVFSNVSLLKQVNLKIPHILDFKLKANRKKGIKLAYRDNINDLIKDIYRNVEKK